ncbi:MAG: hypothetical protein ACPLKP_00635 [Microgenomates group bacterium]
MFLLNNYFSNLNVLAQKFCLPLGNFDCSEKVNGVDFAIFSPNFNSSNSSFDLDNSGLVDLNDALILFNNYGKFNYQNKNNKTVLVIIDQNDFNNLSNQLNQFKNDIETKLGIPIKIIPLENLKLQTPDFVREKLISECGLDPVLGCKNIEGAILVGEVPYALFDSIYDYNTTAPFMFYYQDLDSNFAKNSNNHYDRYLTYGPHEGPEIYISWIKPINDKNFGTPLQQLSRFFDKHHRYFSGEIKSSNKAVYAVHCDRGTPPPPTGIFEGNYSPENIIQIYPTDGSCDNICPLKEKLISAFKLLPEVAYLHSHATATSIFCLNKDDFFLLEKQPAFIFSWGCHNGNFYRNESTSTALASINGKDIGLSYMGKLHAQDINPTVGAKFGNFFNDFFNYWNKGYSVGQALLKTETDWANKKSYDGNTYNIYRLSGPLQRIILGSPFVYSETAVFQFGWPKN